MSNCVMFKGRPVDEMTREELLVVIREIAQIMEMMRKELLVGIREIDQIMEDDRKRYKETIETLSAIRKA